MLLEMASSEGPMRVLLFDPGRVGTARALARQRLASVFVDNYGGTVAEPVGNAGLVAASIRFELKMANAQ